MTNTAPPAPAPPEPAEPTTGRPLPLRRPGNAEDIAAVRAGGWRQKKSALSGMASIDAWAPDTPLGLDEHSCEQIIDLALGRGPRLTGVSIRGDAYPLDRVLTDEGWELIIGRVESAAAAWWPERLQEVRAWGITAARYTEGRWCSEHRDSGRQLAATIQLSDPAAYEGGDFRARASGFDPPMTGPARRTQTSD